MCGGREGGRKREEREGRVSQRKKYLLDRLLAWRASSACLRQASQWPIMYMGMGGGGAAAKSVLHDNSLSHTLQLSTALFFFRRNDEAFIPPSLRHSTSRWSSHGCLLVRVHTLDADPARVVEAAQASSTQHGHYPCSVYLTPLTASQLDGSQRYVYAYR